MKYKINKNQPPLTDADLASARNFNKMLRGYQSIKIPFYRRGNFLKAGSAIIVAAAVTLVVLFGSDDEVAKAFISPPVAQVDIPADSFSITAGTDTVISYPTGSKLYIPADAFRDADGKAVSGPVTLKYREFHDQKDIFISGIPMTYDSGGSTYVFESAGMMEITAYQNGKPLNANPDKQIKVDMVSNTAEDKYNTYYLDTVKKKWINLNQANLSHPAPSKGPAPQSDSTATASDLIGKESQALDPIIAKCEQELKKTTAAVKAMEKEKPMPVSRADKTKTKFHIVVDAGEFPEIAMYQNVRFQVKDELNFDKASARTAWEDVKLKKLTGLDYEVHFTRGAKKMSVIAMPVIEDKDMPAAQKVYDHKFAQYEARLADRKAREAQAKREYEAKLRDMQVRMEIAIGEVKEKNRIYEASLNQSELIYRVFYVRSFGTYNFDHPSPWPTDASVTALLTDERGDKLDIVQLNLVEKGRNIIFPYDAAGGECRDLRFHAAKENTLWAVTADNKLAIVDINSFKAQQARIGKVQFKFKVVDKELKSCEEVKKYLEL